MLNDKLSLVENQVEIMSNKIFTGKSNWRSILPWSLVPAIAFIISVNIGEHIDFYDELVFWVISIIILMWGIISGLVYKDNQSIFYRYDVVKNSFTVLLLAVIFLVVGISLWMQIVDPIENKWYFYNIIIVMPFTFLFSVLWIGCSFFAGYIPAIIVRFFSDNFF